MENETTDFVAYPLIDWLRGFMGLFVCLMIFGIPKLGTDARTLCTGVIPALYTFTGFLVLGEDEGLSQRLGRKFIKSLLLFLGLGILYALLNIPALRMTGAGTAGLKRFFQWQYLKPLLFWNLWPLTLGEPIWMLMALVYAYGICWVLNRLKLLKYDWILAAGLLVITIVTGELAGVIGFRGGKPISGCWLNRALPYLLLGRVVYRKQEALTQLPDLAWGLGALAGIGLAIGEYALLKSTGNLVTGSHMAGYGILAFCLCALAGCYPEELPEPPDFPGRRVLLLAYAAANPINVFCIGLMVFRHADALSALYPYAGFILYAVVWMLTALVDAVVYGRLYALERMKQEEADLENLPPPPDIEYQKALRQQLRQERQEERQLLAQDRADAFRDWASDLFSGVLLEEWWGHFSESVQNIGFSIADFFFMQIDLFQEEKEARRHRKNMDEAWESDDE